MNKELQVFNNEVFGTMRIVDVNGKPYMVASDIAKALGYAAPRNAVAAHCKGALKQFILTNGGKQEVTLIPQGDVYRLIARSKMPNAEKFESWIFDEVVPTVVNTGHYEDPVYLAALETKKMLQQVIAERAEDSKKLAELATIIEKRHKPYTDPRHMYDYARNEYARATGDESRRGIGYAIKEYYGECPYGSEIKPLSVKDWVCRNIGGEEIQEFADAIGDGLIVKTKAGKWVNLSGVFSNDVEIPRLYKEFNNECAYCGSVDNLVIEHINPQVKYSAIDPTKVDLVGNCIIACQCCNKAKNDTMPYKHWYNSDLPFYRLWREKKIDEHQRIYQI